MRLLGSVLGQCERGPGITPGIKPLSKLQNKNFQSLLVYSARIKPNVTCEKASGVPAQTPHKRVQWATIRMKTNGVLELRKHQSGSSPGRGSRGLPCDVITPRPAPRASSPSREEPRAMGTWRRLWLSGRLSLWGSGGAAVPPLGRRALGCGRQVCAECGRRWCEPGRLRAPASGSPRRCLGRVVPNPPGGWMCGVHIALLAWGLFREQIKEKENTRRA